jgi:predicted phage-related endonuclease
MNDFNKPLDGKKQLQEMMNDEWIVTDNENYIEIASTKTCDSIASVHGGKTIGDQYDLAGRIAKVPQLERELTAAREEIKELNDKLDDAVADATNAVNDIIRMKWQRDRLAATIERLKELPDTWRNECQGNWLRSGVVLQLADDFDAAVKGGNDEIPR